MHFSPRFWRIFHFLDKYKGWAWFFVLIPFLYWSTDRDPPIEIVKVYETSPVYAGQDAAFVLDVDRDLSRSCSAVFSRFFTDSEGFRTEQTTNQIVNAQGILQRQKTMGSKLKIRVHVPSGLPPGATTLHTEINYICAGNPLQAIWPLHLSYSWAFTILEPLRSKATGRIIDLEKEKE